MKKHGVYRTALILVCGLILVGWAHVVDSNAADQRKHVAPVARAATVVSIKTPSNSPQVGETFPLIIHVNDLGTGISAFQFDLHYDPSVIEIASGTQDSFIGSTGRNVVCPPFSELNHGVIRQACASSGSATGPTGSGDLIVLTFRALASGSSTLTLNNTTLIDDALAPNPISATNVANQIVVSSNGFVTFLPLVINSASPNAQAVASNDFPLSADRGSRAEPIGDSTKNSIDLGWDRVATLIVLVIVIALIVGVRAPDRDAPDAARHVPRVFQMPRTSQVAHKAISGVVVISILLSLVAPVVPATATATATNTSPDASSDLLSDDNVSQPHSRYGPRAATTSGSPPPSTRPTFELEETSGVGAFWADLDSDHDVDSTDLAIIANVWNCAHGDSCYSSAFDFQADQIIDAWDMAWIGNQHDVAPPEITVVSPVANQVVSQTNVLVDGIVIDKHEVISVTVNGFEANVTNTDFSVAVPLATGQQNLTVVATDALGQIGIDEQIVTVDGDGPMIEIHRPLDRQATYSLTPTLAISYTDFYTGVDTGTFSALILDEWGSTTDVTSDLLVAQDAAFGSLSQSLAADAAYTLTISLADTFGNRSSSQVSFYVPPDPEAIITPVMPTYAGWVSGIVYDSTTCDAYLSDCQGLPGASVTMVYSGGLTISGTIVTGPDGFFAFPVTQTDHYWLRVEKESYTYGQRPAEVVRERSTALNNIYLTPIDTAVTLCDEVGCSHTSSDGDLQLEIPAGAIPPGQVVTTTATVFDQVEFLPSGELPEGTWETYAFNLGGDSDVTFSKPITVSQRNTLGFDPGTEIPLGYWNQDTMEWEHKGFGIVDSTGEWVVMNVNGFSNYDCNFPVALPDVELRVDIDNETDNEDEELDGEECPASEPGCTINVKSGTIKEEYRLPPINILGEQIAPTLLYNNSRAEPLQVIDFKIKAYTPDYGYWKNFASFRLTIEGKTVEQFWFQRSSIFSGDGRLRYLWDGRDAQGNLYPPGTYSYGIEIRMTYEAWYCGADYFGGPPDCVNRKTNILVSVDHHSRSGGIIELDTEMDSPWGNGWTLAGWQRLYEDEAGRIMISDGLSMESFNFPQKNLLIQQQTNQSASMFESPAYPGIVGIAEETNPLQGGSQGSEQDRDQVFREADTSYDGFQYGSELSGDHMTMTYELEEENSDSEFESFAYQTVTPRNISVPESSSLETYHEVQGPSATIVSGAISTDTQWTAGTYIVTDTLTVVPSVTLTIDPGVSVHFTGTAVSLSVQGVLNAIGTESLPIFFRPQSGTTPGSWGRVSFLPGSAGTIRHAVLEYGGASAGIIYIDSDNVQIIESTIRHSANSGVVIHSASPLISSTHVLENEGEHGAGIFMGSGNTTVISSTIENNNAILGQVHGGGIYIQSGSPTLRENQFIGNNADEFGGGLFVASGNPVIIGNDFQDNTGRRGGAIEIWGDEPTISNNRFINNESWNGGAISNLGGRPTIQNNLFLFNIANQDGGAIWNYGSGSNADERGRANIQYNTFYKNEATNDGGAIYNTTAYPNISHNIIVSNTARLGGGIGDRGSGYPLFQSNNLWENKASSAGDNYYGVAPGQTDISENPSFIDAASSDLRLSAPSTSIDIGDPTDHPATDIDGNSRPMGLGPDIGAYEYQTLGVTTSSSQETVQPGDMLTYTITVSNLADQIATNATLVDQLPEVVSYMAYQSAGVTCNHNSAATGGELSCPLGDIQPGASIQIMLTVIPTVAIPSPIQLTNRIHISSTNSLEASDSVESWVSWCNVKRNDGPIGHDLQATVDASTNSSDVIKISGRCLVHDLTVDKTLTLQGGWSIDFSQHDPANFYTILDAQGLGRVIELDSGSFAIPIYPIVEYLDITGGLSVFGSGINIDSAIATIRGNKIHENIASYNGGGINMSSRPWPPGPDEVVIENNIFSLNHTSSYGSALSLQGNAQIKNNTIVQNIGSAGSLSVMKGSPTIYNNIVVSNTVLAGGKSGIIHTNDGIAYSVDYNNIWGNEGGDLDGIFPGPNNISANPLFLDFENSDYRLQATSPSLDTAHPHEFPGADIKGDPRPMGLGVDMGAYERPNLGLSHEINEDSLAPGQTFTYSVEVFNYDQVAAQTVSLTETLSPDLELVSYQSDQLSCSVASTNQLQCSLAELSPGATAQITLTVTADSSPDSPTLADVTALASSANGLTARHQSQIWITWCNIRLNDGTVGNDLQAAINASTQSGDVVKVSGRCLVNDIVLDRGLTLQGGWRSDFASLNPGQYLTILDAQRAGRILDVQGPVSPTIEYLTLVSGMTHEDGGAIHIDSGNPTIRRNVFFGNASTLNDGGAIYNGSGNTELMNNHFQSNAASSYGGALYNDTGDLLIQGNHFNGNWAEYGGGFYNKSGTVSILENSFLDNIAVQDGGAIRTRGETTLQNSILSGNKATRGGGFFAANTTIDVSYNTFYANEVESWGRGRAIYSEGDNYRLIQNNIVVSNTVGGDAAIEVFDSLYDLDYNNVWGNAGSDYRPTDIHTGVHSISADPLFHDPDAGDFHLLPGSPSIDAGDPNLYPDTDFEGDPRPAGARPDMGADEYLSSNPASVSPNDRSQLMWDPANDNYIRVYPDARKVFFHPDGRHDFTLEPDGRKTMYGYDSDGMPTSIGIVPPGEGTPRWTWMIQYKDGNVSSIIDPAGNITQLTMNRHNQLITIEGTDGESRAYGYNQNNLITRATNANGEITAYDYDIYGRITQIIEPARVIYDPLTGVSEVSRGIVQFSPSDTNYGFINNRAVGSPDSPGPPFEGSGLILDTVQYGRGSFSGHTNRYGYWLDRTDGEGRTTYYVRDEANNLTRVENPDGSCAVYSYDGRGNRLTESQRPADQCGNVAPPPVASPVITWTNSYEDRFSQIKSTTDPLSNTITYFYDYEEGVGTAGKLIRIEYPAVQDENGQVVVPEESFTYNQWGLLDSETDRRGVVTKYLYSHGTPDEAFGQANALFDQGVTPVPGLLTQIIRDFGNLNQTTIYRDFNSAGYAQSVIGPGSGPVTLFTYDAWGRLLSEENALGIVTKHEYDGRGNLVKKIQDYTPDGVTGRNVITHYTYDADDRLTSERTSADGLEVGTVFQYDVNGKLTGQVDGNGNKTISIYDDADQLIKVVDPLGHTTTYSYTLNGELDTTIRPDGSAEKMLYDSHGNVVQKIVDFGGLNLTTSYRYDLAGNLQTVTDSVGTSTCYQYDSLNRLSAQIEDCSGLALVSTYVVDLNNNLVIETDPQGVSNRHEYDPLNREIRNVLDIGGLNLVGQYEYDGTGNLVRVTDDQGNIFTLEYSALNQVTRICEDVTGLNLCTSYGYDTLGNLAISTDPNGINSFTQFNGFGLPLVQVADVGGLAATTTFQYDDALNLTQTVDPNGNATTYGYTARNQRGIETFSDGTTVTTNYNERGSVHIRTDQDGHMVTHQYDGAGRVTQKVFSTGGSQSFSYDPAGRMTSARDDLTSHASLVRLDYNSLGDVISTTETLNGLSWSLGYSYDYVGGTFTVTYPSNVERVYTLDPLGRFEVVQDGNGVVIATYDYQDLNGYRTLAYANGTNNRTDFDALGRITRISSGLGDYRYLFDAAGNRISMIRSHVPGTPSDVYRYDNLYRPVEVWYGADTSDSTAITSYDSYHQFALDPLANRLQVTRDGQVEAYAPSDGQRLLNPMNRYENVGGRAFAYDQRGNTLSDGLNSYDYDSLNRATGMHTASTDAEYIYNALGWRVAKVVDGITTHYLQDTSGQVLEEWDETGAMLTRYTYGMGIDQPLTMENGSGTYYYHRDAQGSITEVTDSLGALVERYKYDIYGQAHLFDGMGNPIAQSMIGNHFFYTARRLDEESGIYYFRARLYNPGTGRFLQMDPLGYIDGLNRYSSYFVLNGVDPSGLAKVTIELFKFSLHAGLGASLSGEVEIDIKDCCRGSEKIMSGDRSYTLKVSGSVGLGVGFGVKLIGAGASLEVSGPQVSDSYTLAAKSSSCGSRVFSTELCRVIDLDFGFRGDVSIPLVGIGASMPIQGQFKLCGTIGPEQATFEIARCTNVGQELNGQIGPAKFNLWRHRLSIVDECEPLYQVSRRLSG